MERLRWLACVGLVTASPLFAQEPTLLRTLFNDSKQVYCVAFTPDGKTLVSGGDGQTIKFWDVGTRKRVSAIVAEDLVTVRSVVISPDGKALAAVGYCPGTIMLWDLVSRKKTATIEGDAPSACAAFRENGAVLATKGAGTLKLWDVATGKSISTFQMKAFWWAWFSRDGKTMAVGEDRTITLWDVATQKCTANLKADFYDEETDLAFSPDCKILASVGEHWKRGEQISRGTERSREINLWDVASAKNVAALKGHTDAITSIVFSPDGKSLASGSCDKTIKLWDLATGKCTATLAGHTEDVLSVTFSPDGKTLATGSEDGTIKLWDLMPVKKAQK